MINPLTQAADGTPLVVSATDIPDAATPAVVTREIEPAATRDLFGRLRITEPFVVFASSPVCGLDPYTWHTMASGAGNGVAWSESLRAAIYTLASAGYVVRQSYRYIPYELGRPVQIILTGNFANDVPNVIRERGQMDARNGVFWRRQGDGSMAVGVRSATSGSVVETVIPHTAWNGDTVVFNPALQQVYVIEYVWLGAFAVRWGIATDPQTIRYVHTQEFYDKIPSSYMQTACLPIRDAIYAATDPETPATMQTVCAAVQSEGGYAIQPAFTFSTRRTIAAAIVAGTAPTETPILGIRPALTVGVPGQETVNRVQAAVQEIEVYATAAVDWSLWYFPPGNGDPLTGGSWARVNSASSIEANVAATALTLTGGLRIASGIAVAAGTGGGARGAVSSAIQQTLPLALDICGANNPLDSNVGANPGYLVLSVSGTGSAAGAINWKEVRS